MYQADLGIAMCLRTTLNFNPPASASRVLPSDEMTVMFLPAQRYWGSNPDLLTPPGKHTTNRAISSAPLPPENLWLYYLGGSTEVWNSQSITHSLQRRLLRCSRAQ